MVIGKNLSDSLKDLFNQMPNRVTNETLANVITNLIYRLTRFGLIAFTISFIPIAILIVQTVILSNQNNLLKNQNKRLDQQVYLEEANRRSSLVFLFGNIMDKIDEELRQEKNKDRELSPQLIARIATLSYSLKPYKYLSDDSIIPVKISPEKGHLLKTLIYSEIDSISLRKIYEKSDFSFSDLTGAKFENAHFIGARLDSSKFDNTEFVNCDLSKLESTGSSFISSKFIDCNFFLGVFSSSDFYKSEFNIVKFNISKLDGCDFRETIIKQCDFGYEPEGNMNIKDIIEIQKDSGKELNHIKVNTLDWLSNLHNGTLENEIQMHGEDSIMLYNKGLDEIDYYSVGKKAYSDDRGIFFLIQ